MMGVTADFQTMLAEAWSWYRWGVLDKARAGFADLVTSWPDEPEPARLHAVVLMELGQLEDAIAQLELAVSRHPNCAPLWSMLARACHRARNFVYSEVAARRALTFDPRDPDALLALGASLLERGDARAAREALGDGFAQHPDNIDLAYLGGRVLEQCGDIEAALQAYLSCVAAPKNPQHALLPDAHNNAGLLLLKGGRAGQAIHHFAAAVALREHFPEALYNLGLCHKAEGRLDDSEDCYRRALMLRPAYADALNNLGNLLLAKADVQGAEATLRRALEADPHHVLARANLTAVLVQLGRLEDADAVLAQAGEAQRDAGTLLYGRAFMLVKQERWQEAEEAVAELIHRLPEHVGVMELHAQLLRRKGQLRDAIAALQRVLDLAPGVAQRYSNVGTMYAELREYDRAIEMFQGALKHEPGLAGAWGNLALAYKEAGRLAESEQVLRKLMTEERQLETGLQLAAVLQGQDKRVEATRLIEELRAEFDETAALWCCLGNLLMEEGDLDGGQLAYERVLQLDPDFVVARWNLSFCYLANGDFERGWRHYEYRLSPAMPHSAYLLPRKEATPIWQGEDLRGKHLLVVGEQGYGDNIQCLRFLPVLAARGARVSLLVRPALLTLARSLRGVEHVYTTPPSCDFDYQVLILSLPGLLGVNAQHIPGGIPFIHPHSADVDVWRARSKALAGDRLRIGLAWSGNPEHPNDRHRSMPVEWLRELVGGAEVCWIGLNPAQSVDTVAGVPIVPLARECPDFLATSALVAALDLVITVDTAVAHLAGAVAVPCWVLLAANSDWRWLRGRHDSPWYPSLRLFRQSTLGDWGTVVLDVRTELEQRFSLSLTHVHETL